MNLLFVRFAGSDKGLHRGIGHDVEWHGSFQSRNGEHPDSVVVYIKDGWIWNICRFSLNKSSMLTPFYVEFSENVSRGLEVFVATVPRSPNLPTICCCKAFNTPTFGVSSRPH